MSTTCKSPAKPKRKEPETKVLRLVPPHSRTLWAKWYFAGESSLLWLYSAQTCRHVQARLCVENAKLLREYVLDGKPYQVQTCFNVLGKPICFILWVEGTPIILDPEESIDAQSNWKSRCIDVKLPLK